MTDETATFVPETTEELFWRLVCFIMGLVVSGVVL